VKELGKVFRAASSSHKHSCSSIGKVAPEAGPAVCAILLPAQLSAAVGVAQEITLPQTPAVLAEVILAGSPKQ
jgi:hypothetical protein